MSYQGVDRMVHDLTANVGSWRWWDPGDGIHPGTSIPLTPQTRSRLSSDWRMNTMNLMHVEGYGIHPRQEMPLLVVSKFMYVSL